VESGPEAGITSEAELRELIGDPSGAAVRKERQALHTIHKEWLAHSRFCLLGTSAADGSCDVSPKGDPEGFVQVLDDRTVALPERIGNRRADSFVNILSNPHVGMIFFIAGRGDTLRINGRARLVKDAPWFDRMVVLGKRPVLATVVEIEQVYFHCSKAFLRSELWKPETWQPTEVSSRARISQALERPEDSLELLEEYYGESYAAPENLYR
jgi:hypothetical protein